MQSLAVCADDFGLHAGVNAAVLELAACGRLSTTSAMVGAPAWKQGAGALKERAARTSLEVGLHLDLTEYPLREPPRSLPRLLAAAYCRQLDAAQLEAEILAQWQAFEQQMQAPPHYVDGHQHVHQFPQVREALVRVLNRKLDEGLAQARPRFWVRNTAASAQGLKARLIASLGQAALARQLRALPLRCNNSLLGVYGFDANAQQYLAHLDRWLGQAQPGDLLMCHPGRATDAVHAGSSAAAQGEAMVKARQVEWEVLASDGFAQLLRQHALRVAPMGAS